MPYLLKVLYLLYLSCGCTRRFEQYENIAPRVGYVVFCYHCKKDATVKTVVKL